MDRPLYYMIDVNLAPRVLNITHNSSIKQPAVIEPNNPRTCRISYLHSGSMSVTTKGGTHHCPEGSVMTYFHDHNAVHQPHGPLQTYGFTLVLARDPVPMTAEDVAQWRPNFNEVILPAYITDPAVCPEMADLIKSIVSLRYGQELLFSLKSRVKIHQLFLLLTEYAIRETGTWKTKAIQQESRHCMRADSYIQSHLHEKIAVSDVARATGISYNYLNRLFAAHHGMTMIEYINRAKIRRVEQLLLAERLTAEAAGERVGIQDIKYLSRLFRRYSGMTITEFLRSSGLK